MAKIIRQRRKFLGPVGHRELKDFSKEKKKHAKMQLKAYLRGRSIYKYKNEVFKVPFEPQIVEEI